MADKTKVFISWSGDYSKQFAVTLKSWLEDFSDLIEVFVSDSDIGPGQRSMNVIEAHLRDTSFGIIVTTTENQFAPWLNFEAGALSKEVDDSEVRVIPLLANMDSPAELDKGPLTQFHAKVYGEDGMRQIVLALGEVVGIEPERVRRKFDRDFASLNDEIAKIEPEKPAPAKRGRPKRSTDDMIEETLTLVRAMSSQLVASNTQSVTSSRRSSKMVEATHVRDLIVNELTSMGVKVDARLRQNERGQSVLNLSIYERMNEKDRRLVDQIVRDMDSFAPNVVIELTEIPF